MRKTLGIGALLVALAVASFFAVGMTDNSTYDIQSLILSVFRLNVLMIWVMFVLKLRAAIEGDDLEEDWKRIDQGNIATAIYRGAEFAGIVVAGALLIQKV